MMFASGFLVSFAIGRYLLKRKEREFRNTLIAICEGWAEPDENGYVGWGRRSHAVKSPNPTTSLLEAPK